MRSLYINVFLARTARLSAQVHLYGCLGVREPGARNANAESRSENCQGESVLYVNARPCATRAVVEATITLACRGILPRARIITKNLLK